MLDARFVLSNLDLVRQNCIHRGASERTLADLDEFVRVEDERKRLLKDVESIRRRQNEVAQTTGKERDAGLRAELVAEGKRLKEEALAQEETLRRLEADAKTLLSRIPNLTHPSAPVGLTEDQSVELRREGLPRVFDFEPKDHVALGKAHDWIDFEAGGKVTGHGFYFLKNDAVLLDLALQAYALDVARGRGFTPITTPDLARNTILEGIGFNPRGPETQIYSIEQSDLSLVGTAEITLGGMHAGEVFEEAELPLKYVGISHCFRTEAGAAGKASKGLYRVHQFTKVELFAYTVPERSGEMHESLLAIEEEIFQGLEIPYRVLDICSGDLGGPAYRKFDIEAWMPGRGEKGEYGEVTSTSDCTDYQSRRLDIRYKPTGQKGTRFVHTLNGTAVAISRALIAVLENHQTAEGRVLLPQVLRKYMGGRNVIGGAEMKAERPGD